MTHTHSLPPPAPGWALFLDVDGTLIEIADRPSAVRVEPRMIGVLTALVHATDGAVALVSGRPVADLDRLFAPLVLPAAGLHGLERRDVAGRWAARAAREPAVDRFAASFADFAASHPGALVEDKGLTVALHYRLAPEAADEARALADRLAAESGGAFRVQHGKMVAELRPEGPDKGAVVAAFMAEPPFAGRLPVFVGDDVTDEAGFAEVNRRGGHSVRVGDATVPSAARWRVPSVAALADWLAGIAAAETTA